MRIDLVHFANAFVIQELIQGDYVRTIAASFSPNREQSPTKERNPNAKANIHA